MHAFPSRVRLRAERLGAIFLALSGALSLADAALGEGGNGVALPPPQQAPIERTVAETPRDVAVHGALARGLAWLAKRQAEGLDGSIPVGANAEVHVPVATTALGALALMAGGNADGRGALGANVLRAVDYLLAHSKADGFIGRDTEPPGVKMHGHGFATLALAQAYSVSPRTGRGERLRGALQAAVRLIERSQGGEGGWFYAPMRSPQHEGSVTVCLVQALRAARNAGINVDFGVVRRAEEYVKKTQRENGLFAYELGNPDVPATLALTAAGVSTLYALGEYAGDSVEHGIDAIWRELELRALGTGELSRFPHYERLYLAEALWQHPDPTHFERWSRKEFKDLLAEQEPEGNWKDAQYGDGYATAMNCLVLAMSEELLPIFQR